MQAPEEELRGVGLRRLWIGSRLAATLLIAVMTAGLHPVGRALSVQPTALLKEA